MTEKSYKFLRSSEKEGKMDKYIVYMLVLYVFMFLCIYLQKIFSKVKK